MHCLCTPAWGRQPERCSFLPDGASSWLDAAKIMKAQARPSWIRVAVAPLPPTESRLRRVLSGRLSVAVLLLAAFGVVRAAASEAAYPPNKEKPEAKFLYPQVSETACPAEAISISAAAGHKVTAVVRKPPGKGPFPAIIFLHGGLKPFSPDKLKSELLTRPTYTRYLAAGYVTIAATFRSREADPQTRNALNDCFDIVAYVKNMREVDPKSVVVLGGSGGGSLALELAGETDLCAVAAGEPASVLFTGMMTAGMTQRQAAFQEMMKHPKEHYTPELQEFTRRKIAKIHCPVFIGHGDVHAINRINEEIIMPEMRKAGKDLQDVGYPGQPHGFYFGGVGDPRAGEKFFNDTHRFFEACLPSKPVKLDESLITRVPVTHQANRQE